MQVVRPFEELTAHSRRTERNDAPKLGLKQFLKGDKDQKTGRGRWDKSKSQIIYRSDIKTIDEGTHQLRTLFVYLKNFQQERTLLGAVVLWAVLCLHKKQVLGVTKYNRGHRSGPDFSSSFLSQEDSICGNNIRRTLEEKPKLFALPLAHVTPS